MIKKLRFSIGRNFHLSNMAIVIDNPAQDKHSQDNHFGAQGANGNNPPFPSVILEEDALKHMVKYLQDYLEGKCEK